MALTVLLGGARSGKSRWAVRLAAEARMPVTFIATGEARDAEMADRIRRHRAERRPDWTTIEEPIKLPDALRAVDAGRTVVVDCMTLWVANLLEQELRDDEVRDQAEEAADMAAAHDGDVIVVSNEVGSGIVPITALGRRYQDLLGEVNAIWVEHASRAALVVAGRPLWLPDTSAAGPL
ncbi:MAG: bifunctional adenosylcobinamide kinase/adenosylcobinamide-phosphate guanylyltransferase [Candidatus Limnocylindria bacterium]